MPEELLGRVDGLARGEGWNRSQAVIYLLGRGLNNGGKLGAEIGDNSRVDKRGVGGGITEPGAGAVFTGGVRAVAGGGGGAASGARAGAGKGRGEGSDKAALRACADCGALGGVHQKGCAHG